jgi:heterodisulfide reductase subunit A
MADTPRIGVYVCHCGANIAATVDVVAVAEEAAKLDGVQVARHCTYMCSDAGAALIRQDIQEHGLNRIVVAACSPHLHEPTFRHAVAAAGLNPHMVQMANIREQDAWVHTDPTAATRKAHDLVRAAVRRVAHHEPIETRQATVHPDVLVIGGGIAGMHAALTVANAGRRVYLVERELSIGGQMARYDKTFPTLDCSLCIQAPKMTAVRTHPLITLWTSSEVETVEGHVGSYRVRVRRRPRYVREGLCVGCLQCVDACCYDGPPIPDEFNMGLSARKPIYLPFAHAVPTVVAVDADTCLQFTSGGCSRPCAEVCGRDAIDFDQEPWIEEVMVGSIIVATGFEPFDASRAAEYGYGLFPNVYTSMEVERLVNASGPTAGDVILRDGRRPEAIGVIYCVGSRDERHNPWCSRVCCMTALKLSHLLRERTRAEVFNFYTDMRAAGKGQEEFYQRVLSEGVQFVRGKVAEVCDWALDPSEEGKLVIRVEDTMTGYVRRVPVDMVVLVVGMSPRSDADRLRRRLNVGCSGDGFYRERHAKLAPVSTLTDGIFIAGCCQGPKDIADSVSQAGSAAAEAIALSVRGSLDLEPITASIIEEACSGCRACMPECPYGAISFDGTSGKCSISAALCTGCGACVAACPSGAIRQGLFDDAQVFEEIAGLLEPTTVGAR